MKLRAVLLGVTTCMALSAGYAVIAQTQSDGKQTATSIPRITPLPVSEWTPEQRKMLEPIYAMGPFHNAAGTLARHWETFKVWAPHFGFHEMQLPPKDRELMTLRTVWLCRSEYVFAQHVLLGKKVGLTTQEIARVKEGPGAKGWTPFQVTLLNAADELHKDYTITDKTWAELSERYNTQQLLDVAYSVGVQTLACMSTNSVRMQVDQGVKGGFQVE